MKKILVLLDLVTIASIVAAAWGGDDDDLVSGSTSNVDPSISIGEELTSNLTGPLLINGHVYVQNG